MSHCVKATNKVQNSSSAVAAFRIESGSRRLFCLVLLVRLSNTRMPTTYANICIVI